MKEADQKLIENLKKDIFRKKKSEQESHHLLAQTTYLGTLGIIISLPIVAGAYLGAWLDERLQGFSFSWTVSLIIIGVFVGSMNVYFFLKENE